MSSSRSYAMTVMVLTNQSLAQSDWEIKLLDYSRSKSYNVGAQHGLIMLVTDFRHDRVCLLCVVVNLILFLYNLCCYFH